MLLFSLVILLVLPWCRADQTAACSDLVRLSTPSNITVYNASYYPAGSLNLSALAAYDGSSESDFNDSAFCRVFANISNSESQLIQFELWLVDPEKWNGRYLAMGNGGLAGSVTPGVLAYGVNNGFATSQCDSGHQFPDGYEPSAGDYVEFLHNEVQTEDWLHNSIHYMSLASKLLTQEYYGRQIKHSYYQGCSTGGAQGFSLVQRHPNDFDGIIAGCPGAYYSHLALSFLYNARATQGDAAISAEQLEWIQTNAVKACDGLDGSKDGLISNPLDCHFDVYSLVCGRSHSKLCLSRSQAHAMQLIYEGTKDPVTGKSLYYKFVPGSEGALITQEGSLNMGFTQILMQNLWGKGVDYNGTVDFNFHTDVPSYDSIVGKRIDDISADIDDFISLDKKLIIYQGWSDQYNAQTFPMEYFKNVSYTLGKTYEELNQNVRLFYQPGVQHCGGGYGPNVFDPVKSMVDWVESGEAPDRIIATETGNNRSRPYCVWPKSAKYNGHGPVDKAESFDCC